MAIELYLRVRIVEILPDAPGTIATTFTGAAPDGENRIETAFLAAGRDAARPVPGVRIEVETEIPVRAGLGSSGAATVAGMRIYEALTAPRPGEEWLPLAREIEGHPDNVVAALFGGVTLSCQQRRWRDHRARVELAGRPGVRRRDTGGVAPDGIRATHPAINGAYERRGVQPPARGVVRARPRHGAIR